MTLAFIPASQITDWVCSWADLSELSFPPLQDRGAVGRLKCSDPGTLCKVMFHNGNFCYHSDTYWQSLILLLSCTRTSNRDHGAPPTVCVPDSMLMLRTADTKNKPNKIIFLKLLIQLSKHTKTKWLGRVAYKNYKIQERKGAKGVWMWISTRCQGEGSNTTELHLQVQGSQGMDAGSYISGYKTGKNWGALTT